MKKTIILLALTLAACSPEPEEQYRQPSTSEASIVFYPPAKFPTREGCNQRGVLAAVWSLENQPDDWSYDGFRLGKGDISIWVANDDYGLEINGFTGLTQQCRALLFTATQRLAENRVAAGVLK